MKSLNYIRKLEICFIVVLFSLVLLFWLFPHFTHIPYTLPAIHIENIKVLEIPRTVQHRKAASPPPLKPVIPVAGEELEMLEEVPIAANEHLSLQSDWAPGNAPLTEDDLPYVPRQIIEAMPRVEDLKVRGKIVLKLLIDKNGHMKTYKIISNSTGDKRAVQRVVEALRKSRWEVVRLNQTKMEYWITKEYQFK